jgi:hypothetical protein
MLALQPYLIVQRTSRISSHISTKYGSTSAGSIYTMLLKICVKEGKEFLWKLQELLEKILAHLMQTSGILPRSWQAAALQYCNYGDYNHNLWLLLHEVPLVGNPRVKQLDLLIYDAFWALEPHLGLALIFYLGVYQPVEIEIMKALDIPTAEHLYFIFVHMHKRPQLSTYVYDGKKVNQCLEKDTTPELAYESRALRNVQQAIVDRHLVRPHDDIVHSILGSGSNEQAQHSFLTHDTCYAVDQIMRATAMPLSLKDKQLAVSGAIQAWLSFLPRKLDWDRYVNYQPIEEVELNMTLALDTPRRLGI